MFIVGLIKSVKSVIVVLLLLFPLGSLAYWGCCSWHGGVSGYDSGAGKLICRDQTYSPTCRCPIAQRKYQQPVKRHQETDLSKLKAHHLMTGKEPLKECKFSTKVCRAYLEGAFYGVRVGIALQKIASKQGKVLVP